MSPLTCVDSKFFWRNSEAIFPQCIGRPLSGRDQEEYELQDGNEKGHACREVIGQPDLPGRDVVEQEADRGGQALCGTDQRTLRFLVLCEGGGDVVRVLDEGAGQIVAAGEGETCTHA